MRLALILGGIILAFLLIQVVTAYVVVQLKKGRGRDQPGG